MKPRHDGLTEYISRRARIHLLKIILASVGSVRGAASLLGVSPAAVSQWLSETGIHPSNQNLSKILHLAFHFDAKKTTHILKKTSTPTWSC
ncbi:MAG: hypothetical protein QW179_02905 [Candidatus Hadarchaeales archaeon]